MMNSIYRAGLLFTAGASFALLHRLLFLQRQTRLGINDIRIDVLLTSEKWQWITPLILCSVVGAVAAALGLIWPLLEERIGKLRSGLPNPEWTGVLRCSAFFIGINHASAKVEYPSTFQLAVTLAALCCCLWWCFDRSISGMGAGLLTAFASAIISHLYVTYFHQNDGSEEWPEWQLWTPYIFFSGGVTMIILGRHLSACCEKTLTTQIASNKLHED